MCSSNASTYWENYGYGDILIKAPLNSTLYTAVCRQNVCKGNTSNIFINVLQPYIEANTTSICYDISNETRNSSTMTISNCIGTVNWSTGEHGNSITVSPSGSYLYYADCILPNYTSIRSNIILVKVTAKPTVAKTVINRSFYQLAATCSPGNTFLWSTGATTSSIQVSSGITQAYTAYCKDGNCASKGTKKKIYAAPEVSSNLSAICEGQTIQLTAEGCDGIVSWYSGNGTTLLSNSNPYNFLARSIFINTTYTFRATCTVGPDTTPYSNIISIEGNTGTPPSAPTVSSNPNPALLNLGKSITFSSRGCDINQTFWSSGENTTSVTKTPLETTNYFAYCYGGTCPSNLSNITVTVVDVPPPVINAAAIKICEGQNAFLTATGCNGTVNWWSVPANNTNAPPTSHGSSNPKSIFIVESKSFYSTCSYLGVISDESFPVVVTFSPRPTSITSDPNPAILWEG